MTAELDWLGIELASIVEEKTARSSRKRRFETTLADMEEAISQAQAIAEKINTSGARNQVVELEEKLQALAERAQVREAWIEANADLLHTYSAVGAELQHRVDARTITYQLTPPSDLLEAIGPRPTSQPQAARWDAAAALHAEARIRLGPDVEFTDPAILEAACWRDAVSGSWGEPRIEGCRPQSLRLVG